MKTSFATLICVLSAPIFVGAQNPLPPGAQLPPGQPTEPAPASAPAAAEAESEADFPPKRFEVRRYDAIARKNPFQKETQIDKNQPEEDWAKDLQLRAVTKLDGKWVVHLENAALKNEKDLAKRRARFRRLVEGDTAEGLRIQKVSPHRDPKQVEVTLANSAGKTAHLKYDQNLIKTKGPGAMGQGNVIPPTTTPIPMQSINMGGNVPPPTTGGALPPGIQPPGVQQPANTPNFPNRRGQGGGGFNPGGGQGGFNPAGGGRQGGNNNNNQGGGAQRRRVILPPGVSQ